MAKNSDPRAGYLAVATRVFAAHGYHGASLARLAEEAGVTKQALLHFFGTKERLYAEVLSELSDRQIAELTAASSSNAKEHLEAYFSRLIETAFSAPDDVRLVVRALLDSTDAARVWPLKPYVDGLVDVFQATPAGRDKSIDEVRTLAFQVFGAIQYLAIASPTVSGMYGKDAANRVAAHLKKNVEEFVRTLALVS